MDDGLKALHGLLNATVALCELPHSGQVGRVLLAAAVAGSVCSDDAIARSASLPGAVVRDVIPTMLERCQHVPALLAAKANRTPANTIFSGICLTSEAERRLIHLREYVSQG